MLEVSTPFKVVVHLKTGQTIELIMDNRPSIDMLKVINLQGFDPKQSPEAKPKQIAFL